MSKLQQNWDQMVRLLEAFTARHGNCDVPANYADAPALGRWVAVQRFRRKTNRLTADQVARLDKLGFIWAPGQISWERGLAQLLDFKARYGHCDVPTHCETHPNLGGWVANQRHRKKTGKLSADRVRRLDAVGFKWFIYGMENTKRKTVVPVSSASAPRRNRSEPESEIRIFNLGHDEFIPYDGKGALPRELQQYAKAHGEYPPFIPMPSEPTRFILNSNGFGRERIVKWSGKGRISEEILDYVRENGCLPPRK